MQKLPQYVTAALASDKTAQLRTIAALTVDLFVRSLQDEDTSDYGSMLFRASPHKSLKTWQNYASTANALAVKACHVKLADFAAQADEAATVGMFADWLDLELKKKGYTTGVEDVGNFANGRPSLKAKDRAKRAAEVEQANLQQAAPAAAPAPATPSPTAQLTQPEATAQAAPPTPQATEAATQPEDRIILQVTDKGSEYGFAFDDAATIADMETIIEFVSAKLVAARAALTQHAAPALTH